MEGQQLSASVATASATQSPPGSATQSPSPSASATLPASVDRALDLHTASQAITDLRNTLRINPLMDIIERALRPLSREELNGALVVLGPLSSYLQSQWVDGQEPAFDKKKLVKTIEELFEIAVETSLSHGYSSDEDSE
jgi:hypothetical protein